MCERSDFVTNVYEDTAMLRGLSECQKFPSVCIFAIAYYSPSESSIHCSNFVKEVENDL